MFSTLFDILTHTFYYEQIDAWRWAGSVYRQVYKLSKHEDAQCKSIWRLVQWASRSREDEFVAVRSAELHTRTQGLFQPLAVLYGRCELASVSARTDTQTNTHTHERVALSLQLGRASALYTGKREGNREIAREGDRERGSGRGQVWLLAQPNTNWHSKF